MSSLFTSAPVKGTFVNGDVATGSRLIAKGIISGSTGSTDYQTYITPSGLRSEESVGGTIVSASQVTPTSIVSGGYLQQTGTGVSEGVDGTTITYDSYINPGGSTGVPAEYQGAWDPATQYTVGQSVSIVLDTAPFYTALQPPTFVATSPYPPASYVTDSTIVYQSKGGDPVQIPEYSGVATYSVGQIVWSGDVYYQSLTGTNTAPPSVDWAEYSIIWNNLTSYVANNIVVYGNKAYRCLGPITGGNPPPANTIDWRLVVPVWSPVAVYTANDYVTYLGVLYQSLPPGGVSATPPPLDPTNWSAITLSVSSSQWDTALYSTGVLPPANPLLWKSTAANPNALSEFVTTSLASPTNLGTGTGFGWVAQGTLPFGTPRVLGALTDQGLAVPALLIANDSYGTLQPTIGSSFLSAGPIESFAIIQNRNITPESYIFLQPNGCRGPLTVDSVDNGVAVVLSPNYIFEDVPIPDIGFFWYWIINPNPIPRGIPPVPVAAPPPPPPAPTYEELLALERERIRKTQ